MKTIPFGGFAAIGMKTGKSSWLSRGGAISMKVMEENRVTSVFYQVFIFTR